MRYYCGIQAIGVSYILATESIIVADMLYYSDISYILGTGSILKCFQLRGFNLCIHHKIRYADQVSSLLDEPDPFSQTKVVCWILSMFRNRGRSRRKFL